MAHSVYLLTCYSPKSNKSCQSRHTRRCEKLVENIKYFFSAYVIFGKVFVSFPPRNGVGKATLRWMSCEEWGLHGVLPLMSEKNPPPTDFVRALHPVNHGLWTMVCGGGNLQCYVLIWFFKYNPWFLVLKIIQNPRTAAFQFQFFFFLTKNQNPRIVFCNYLRNIKAPTVIKMVF